MKEEKTKQSDERGRFLAQNFEFENNNQIIYCNSLNLLNRNSIN